MTKYKNRSEMAKSVIQPGSRIAELGVMNGDFSQTLLETSPQKLYLVDNWQYKMSGHVNGQNRWFYPEACLLNVFQQVSQEIKRRQVEIHIRNVLDFLDNAPPLDYIYLDDTHEYQHVKTELSLCRAPIVFVHDYCEVFPGVMKAVDESGYEIIGITEEKLNPVFPRGDWMPEQVAYNTVCLMRPGTF